MPNPPNTYTPPYPALIVLGQSYSTRQDGNGPFQDNGPYVNTAGTAQFLVLMLQNPSTSAYISVFRSTDSGLTWAEADSANRKLIGRTATGSFAPWALHWDGADTLYFAHSATIVIDQFSMSTALWGAQVASGGPVQDASTFNSYTDYVHMFLTKRGTDYLVLYQGQDTVFGSTYARCRIAVWNGSTWSTQNVGNGGASSFFSEAPAAILLGTNNRTHIWYTSDETTVDPKLHHRVFDSNGVLQTQQMIDPNFEIFNTATAVPNCNAVATPRLIGSDVYITYLRQPTSGPGWELATLIATSADTPTWTGAAIPGSSGVNNVSHYGMLGTLDGHLIATTVGGSTIGIMISANYDYNLGPNSAGEHQFYFPLPVRNPDDEDYYVFWLHDRDTEGCDYVYARRSATTGLWDDPEELYVFSRATSIYARVIAPACPAAQPATPVAGNLYIAQ